MSNYPDGFGSKPEDHLDPRSPLNEEPEYAVDKRIDDCWEEPIDLAENP